MIMNYPQLLIPLLVSPCFPSFLPPSVTLAQFRFASDGPNAETVINRVLHLLLLTERPMNWRRGEERNLESNYITSATSKSLPLHSALCRQLDGEMCTLQVTNTEGSQCMHFHKRFNFNSDEETVARLRISLMDEVGGPKLIYRSERASKLAHAR